MPIKTPKIAIVHDWLTTMGGAEKTILALHEAFPEAPIYTSVYEPETMPDFAGLTIRTTWLQKFPKAFRKLHKFFPILRVWAFRSLNLSEFDILVVSSSAESKQIKKLPHQTIICYCHTPIRYYWSHYAEYKKDPGFGSLNWLVRLAMPLVVPLLKKADYKAAQQVDVFIANSSEVQARIKKYYDRTATIVYPPVEVDRFTAQALNKQRQGFVIVGRQVPYKRFDLAVAVCTKLKLPLAVYGNGGEHERLKKMAGPTITFHANAPDTEIAKALGRAEAFIFPAEEDFGIVQAEALAAGTPVIAINKGGSREIIQDGETGILFNEQTVASLAEGIARFQKTTFLPATLHRKSKRFHRTLFISKIQKIVAGYAKK